MALLFLRTDKQKKKKPTSLKMHTHEHTPRQRLKFNDTLSCELVKRMRVEWSSLPLFHIYLGDHQSDLSSHQNQSQESLLPTTMGKKKQTSSLPEIN